MNNRKKIIITVAIICALGCAAYYFVNKQETTGDENINQKEITKETTLETQDNAVKENGVNKNTSETKSNLSKQGINTDNKADTDKNKHTGLLNKTYYSDIPLSAITALALLPENIQDTVSDISKNGNIYMIKKINDKLLIISDNSENIRHGIEFTEISLDNGHQVNTTLGYNDKIKDSQNDIWEYNQETNLPVRHTKYNSDGDMDFVEVWNYDSDPIKYEMKDSDGKVISMRKETLKDGTDLRIEHLIYDKDGNTLVNISTTYEGADIKRFTYYNAEKPNEGGSIFSDYTDGNKTKETVYTSDLKVKNTYTSKYKDGSRENIIMYNNQNQEIERFLPSEDL